MQDNHKNKMYFLKYFRNLYAHSYSKSFYIIFYKNEINILANINILEELVI